VHHPSLLRSPLSLFGQFGSCADGLTHIARGSEDRAAPTQCLSGFRNQSSRELQSTLGVDGDVLQSTERWILLHRSIDGSRWSRMIMSS
jgi:hypothetical protein